jgi:hypothetical protein
MTYTCFEMVRDCRENRAEGWSFFIMNYVPVVRKLVGHYRRADAPGSLLDRVLQAMRGPESRFFSEIEPMAERPFVARLRQRVVQTLDQTAPLAEPDLPIDLETLDAAADGFTVLEKQTVWLETMGYNGTDTGAFLRTAETTIEKIRGRAAERLRAQMDGWSVGVLAENGRRLAEQIGTGGPQCLPEKAFLNMLDGRATWRGREDLESHVNGCWHCIDHFCRMVEATRLLRQVQPLSEPEAEAFHKLLGIETAAKQPGWKRLFGTG